MIKVEYGELSNRSLENYFNFLVGKVYKILPLKEQECKTLNNYLESLKVELIGNSELLFILKDEPQFVSLLNIIQYFISNKFDNRTCKREVFRAIRIIESINNKYFKEGDDVKS